MKLSKKYVKVLVLLIVILFGSCTKEDSEPEFMEQNISSSKGEMDIETVSLSEAKDYFNKIQETKLNKAEDKLGLEFDFKTLRLEDLKDSNAKIVVMNSKTKFSGLRTEALQLRVNNKLETVLLDKNKKGFDVDGMYTGPVVCTDFQGSIYYMFKMEKDEILGEYIQDVNTEEYKSSSLSSRVQDVHDEEASDPCWGIACGMVGDEVVVTGSRTYVNYNSGALSTGIWAGTNYNNTYTGYAAGYMQYQTYLVSARFEFPDAGPKVDPEEELKCFDKSKGGKITIYVEQPIRNSREITTNIGHTFIGIEQGGIERYLGFYPVSNAASLLGPQESSINDNSSSAYDVSITLSASSSQMNDVLDYVTNYRSQYDLNNYNCTDFGIGVAEKGGLTLPRTIGEYDAYLIKFKGRNPVDLGQDIRQMSAPDKGSINKNSGDAPSKKGGC